MNRTLAAALVTVAFTITTSAHADGRFLSVSSEGCTALHDGEVERILAIELAPVSASWSSHEPLRVELTCEGMHVRTVAIDPVTDKRLSREIDLQAAGAARDRTVALLVSQLFLSSWSELLIEARREAPLVPHPAPPPAVTHAAESMARDATGAGDTRIAVGAVIGPRVRAFDAPRIGGHVGVRPSLSLGPHARVLLELGYERGSASRALGSVSTSIASALAGASWRTQLVSSLAVEMGALAGVAYVDASGDAISPATGAGARSAVGEGAFFAGPVLSSGIVHIGLEASLGLTFPRAVARVERGDDVVVSGLWAGLGLAVAIGDERR